MDVTHFCAKASSKSVEGSRSLLEILEAQQRIVFQDIVTGDENFIDLDTNQNLNWIDTEETTLTRLRLMISSTKVVSAVVQGICGVILIN
jgi:hypothetical protein